MCPEEARRLDVYINGEFVTASKASLRKAVQEAARFVPPGMGFGRVWVDGIAYAGVTCLPDASDTTIRRVDIEALTTEVLARQTAASVCEYLERLVPYVANVVRSLRFGEDGAIEKLEPLVPAFGYLDLATQAIRAADTTANGVGVVEADRLTKRLAEVVDALEGGDAVEAADLLEYTIKPELEMLERAMRVRSRAGDL